MNGYNIIISNIILNNNEIFVQNEKNDKLLRLRYQNPKNLRVLSRFSKVYKHYETVVRFDHQNNRMFKLDSYNQTIEIIKCRKNEFDRRDKFQCSQTINISQYINSSDSRLKSMNLIKNKSNTKIQIVVGNINCIFLFENIIKEGNYALSFINRYEIGYLYIHTIFSEFIFFSNTSNGILFLDICNLTEESEPTQIFKYDYKTQNELIVDYLSGNMIEIPKEKTSNDCIQLYYLDRKAKTYGIPIKVNINAGSLEEFTKANIISFTFSRDNKLSTIILNSEEYGLSIWEFDNSKERKEFTCRFKDIKKVLKQSGKFI